MMEGRPKGQGAPKNSKELSKDLNGRVCCIVLGSLDPVDSDWPISAVRHVYYRADSPN